MADRTRLFAVIMAGGRGERFWPAGRHDRPKQFLPLLGDRTMLEETVLRLFPLIAPEDLLVITNVAHVDRVRALLPIPAENVVGEPGRRARFLQQRAGGRSRHADRGGRHARHRGHPVRHGILVCPLGVEPRVKELVKQLEEAWK